MEYYEDRSQEELDKLDYFDWLIKAEKEERFINSESLTSTKEKSNDLHTAS
jgi:hypothetical protein